MRRTQRDDALQSAMAALDHAKAQAALSDPRQPVMTEPPANGVGLAHGTPSAPELNGHTAAPAEPGTDPLRRLDERDSQQKPLTEVFGVPVTEGAEEEKLVYLSFRLPEPLRDAVHVRCRQYRMSVQEFGHLAVELLLTEMEKRSRR